jgi:hypothetical protein
MKKLLVFIAASLGFSSFQLLHAQTIDEVIVSVKTSSGLEQQGVLSKRDSASIPKKLIVIVSGHPGVTRPRINGQGKITTRQNGNFLVRSRHHLISDQVITLLLDCRSDFDSMCPDHYQVSAERAQDIDDLVREVKKQFPSIEQIWALSTSRGVLTTAGLLKHAQGAYAGIIHTAGTYNKVIEQGLNFGPFKTPQYIFHHRQDPCPITLHKDAVMLSRSWGVVLVTVDGGSGFKGDPCQAFTQHGFAGREEKVAVAIRQLVETGAITQTEID